jgi:hypothetical protein
MLEVDAEETAARRDDRTLYVKPARRVTTEFALISPL